MQSELTVDGLAQEIRRVDGNHSLGAGALAEALMPFLSAFSDKQAGEVKTEGAGPSPSPHVAGWDAALAIDTEPLRHLTACVVGAYDDALQNAYCPSSEPYRSAMERVRLHRNTLDRLFDSMGAIPSPRSALVDVPAVESVALIEREVLPELAKHKTATGTVCSPLLKSKFGDKVPLYTRELLREGEDSAEVERLRGLLSRAEEYVIDGVTNAKAEAEMNAPYPARAPRYDAALAEVRQLYADIQAALAATSSGSAAEHITHHEPGEFGEGATVRAVRSATAASGKDQP